MYNVFKTSALCITLYTTTVFSGGDTVKFESAVVRLLWNGGGPKAYSGRGYRGALANEAMISKLMENHQLASVLMLVWAEHDPIAQCNFLKARAEEGYVIFMLEHARYIIDKSPNDGLFWFIAGLIRLKQDLVSLKGGNEQVIEEVAALEGLYTRLINVKSRFSLEQLMVAKEHAISFLRQRPHPFPSPTWLLATPGESTSLEPPEEMQRVREMVFDLFSLNSTGFYDE